MKLALSLVALLSVTGLAHASAAPAAQTPIPNASTGPAPATSPTSSPVQISGWRFVCDPNHNETACQVLNQVTVRNNNVVLAAVSVREPKAKAPIMIIQAPLGVALDDNIRVGFENGVQQTMPFITCNHNGCFSRAQISDPLLNSLHTAKQQLRITYGILNANQEKQTVTVSLGLDGFAGAYKRLH